MRAWPAQQQAGALVRNAHLLQLVRASLQLGECSNSSKESMDDFKWRELRNGRLAMVAFLGFLAQHAATGKGPLENLAGGWPQTRMVCCVGWAAGYAAVASSDLFPCLLASTSLWPDRHMQTTFPTR